MEPLFLAARGLLRPVPALLAAVIMFSACQDSLLYHPQGNMAGNPSTVGLGYRDMYITASDGVPVNAWWVPAGKAGQAVLFCHGNAGNISHRLDTIRMLNGMGLGVMIFDYRGFGKSGGSPSENGTYRDAEAVWNYMVGTLSIPPDRIIVMGRSLGAVVASWLAREKGPSMLIVESGFYSLHSIARHYCRLCPLGVMLSYRYETGNNAAAARCPVLVIHSPDDEVVPYSQGVRIYNGLKGERRFLKISGSHNTGFLMSGNVYRSGLLDFINKYKKD